MRAGATRAVRAAIGTVVVLLATPLALSVPHAAAQTGMAQTGTAQTDGTQAGSAPAKAHVPLRTRFDAANTTHDGRLTLAQAQAAGLHGVVRHFAAIDADHKGYVTLGDIRAFHQARKAAAAPARRA